jgi:farnesyl diphosphate synthase
MAADSFEGWKRACLQRFESAAERRLPPVDVQPRRLHEAIRYAVLDGGKRVRPLLAYAAGEVVRADGAALDCVALAVEYVHAYSLIHDDLPCMDNDMMRRGKPTVHVAFDEATAMLAGDALQAEAFRVLSTAPLDAAVRADLMQTLALAAGTAGMCGGQALDLQAVGSRLSVAELERMHRMKTGALLAAAVHMGALAGSVPEPTRAALDRYSQAVGLAFQVVDDLLDAESTSEQLGKTAGKDAEQNKPTYVSVLGAAAARALAAELRAQAHEALAGLGMPAQRLRQLADYIVLRSS